MEFKEVTKVRYSCKKYSDRQVEAEKLTAILTAGRLAPTAKNLQEQHRRRRAVRRAVLSQHADRGVGLPVQRLLLGGDQRGEEREAGADPDVEPGVVRRYMTLLSICKTALQ